MVLEGSEWFKMATEDSRTIPNLIKTYDNY